MPGWLPQPKEFKKKKTSMLRKTPKDLPLV